MEVKAAGVFSCRFFGIEKEENPLAFVKVKNITGKEDTIINTDMICKITKSKNGCTVFFSSGNVGAAYYECDQEDANKIFDVIGISL